MKWFDGEIASAIKAVKSTSSLLFVFVKDGSEVSATLEENLNHDDVASHCDSMICLNLETESQSGKQFSAVYPVSVIPSLYLIQPSGTILSTKTENFSVDELVDWITTQASKYVAVPDEPLQTPSADEPSRSGGQEDTVVQSSAATAMAESAAPVVTDATFDEQVQYARQRLETRHALEAEEEVEKVRQAEILRRQEGKDLADFKNFKREQELKEQLKERKREQEESRAARERVLRQIQEDRMEREAKAAGIVYTDAGSSTITTRQPTAPVVHSLPVDGKVRLQLRLSTGGHLIGAFEPEASLENEVRSYIFARSASGAEAEASDDSFALTNELRSRFAEVINGGYYFRQLAPVRRFSQEEEKKTLLDLGLLPSAVLILVSVTGRNTASNSASSGTVRQYSQSGFQMLYGFISTMMASLSWLLNGALAAGRSVINVVTGGGGSPSAHRLGGAHHDAPYSTPPVTTTAQTPNSENRAVRRRGNVARLSHRPDNDEDEQARWNGNSTTQL